MIRPWTYVASAEVTKAMARACSSGLCTSAQRNALPAVGEHRGIVLAEILDHLAFGQAGAQTVHPDVVAAPLGDGKRPPARPGRGWIRPPALPARPVRR